MFPECSSPEPILTENMRQAPLPSEETKWESQNISETAFKLGPDQQARPGWVQESCSVQNSPEWGMHWTSGHKQRATNRVTFEEMLLTSSLPRSLHQSMVKLFGGLQKQATTLGKISQRKGGPWRRKKLENLARKWCHGDTL